MQFSGPDQVSQQDIDATTQEWYQPIHEPGNIFSYPWTVAQLQQSLPNLIALTGDPNQPNWRGTDTSSSAYSTKWNQGTQNEQSSGSVSTTKMDASVTVAAGVSIEGFGVSGSTSFALTADEDTDARDMLSFSGSGSGARTHRRASSDRPDREAGGHCQPRSLARLG